MASEIPLRNIWILFLYAADLVQLQGRFERDVEQAQDLPDLIGRLMAHVVEDRLHRNLSRGYQARTAVLPRVRGHIDMLATEETGHRCRSLAADFARAGVSARRPSRAELATDQIGRNENADRMMVALARMVFDGTIPTETTGASLQPGDETTEHLIRRLFERAIGNALRIALKPEGWSIAQGRRLAWPVSGTTPGLSAILPGMQTDIELTHPETERHVVIDTKFIRILTRSNHRDEILRSGYLYQMYAYLRTQEHMEQPPSLTSEGILLHPQVGGSVDETLVIQGHPISFRTIDLTAPTTEFASQLHKTATAQARIGI